MQCQTEAKAQEKTAKNTLEIGDLESHPTRQWKDLSADPPNLRWIPRLPSYQTEREGKLSRLVMRSEMGGPQLLT